MPKTETPLTDAVCITPLMGDNVTPHKWDKVQELARRLERERGELVEALKELLQEIDNLEGVEYTRDIEPYKAESVWTCTIDRARALLAKLKETP